MSGKHPYLQRRGDSYFFRIAVPAELRPAIGSREITRTLATSDRRAAIPLALELGAIAKHIFHILTTPMTTDDLRAVLQVAKEKLKLQAAHEKLDEEVTEAHRLRIAAVRELERAREVDKRIADAKIETLEKALASAHRSRPDQPSTASSRPVAVVPEVLSPTLSEVISDFVSRYPKDNKSGMFKKHQAALALMQAVLGDRRVDTLRQRDVVKFFDLVQRLPARWAQQCKKRGISLLDLAAEEHGDRLSKKTFADNYLNPIGIFLRSARTHWQDQGFPTNLTTDAIGFSGQDDEGKNRQRAFRVAELEQLFHKELAMFRNDPQQAHCWWLPALSYYTGARVNELCQLNPQTDVLVSHDDINYILITEDTEGDERLRKSVKTGVKRHVPLHPVLIEGGFLEYVAGVRKSKSKLLFPAWKPTNGRASTQAERWFRDLLRETGIRDDSPGAKVVGFHAFRHTLLSMALNSLPQVDAGPITGHADPEKSSVQRDYEGELSLPNKLKILTAIQFSLDPFAKSALD